MGEKRIGDGSFADAFMAPGVGRNARLDRIEDLFEWSRFTKLLKPLRSTQGRKGYPALMMFKALLLQQWYSLSDPGLEEALLDRLSFRRFCGFSLDDATPDETTFVRFRSALATRGLAAGNPWPVEYGPELSRGFRALKIWAQITEHGTEALGAMISKNCAQAQLLAGLVTAHPDLTLQAPVTSSVVCFRFGNSDAINAGGVAAPSVTTLDGQVVIRVNITNHRTRDSDMEVLVDEVVRVGGGI